MNRMMGSLNPEDAKKMKAAMDKATGGKQISELSQEERTKVFAQMRDMMAAMQKKNGGTVAAPATTAAAAGAEGEGGGGRRQRGGGGGMPMFGGGGQFTQKDLDAARLPLPPEEDTQFDVLLRPGLLADVQIIIEKIPNAINVPMQAVFEKEGKPSVFVKKGNKFELREIKPLKRSENVMTIASGVDAGETVALADPTAKKGADKKEKGGGAISALPGGKS